MKRRVKLTESQLRNIIKESVKQVLKENENYYLDDNFEYPNWDGYNPFMNGDASWLNGEYDINGYHIIIKTQPIDTVSIVTDSDEYFLQDDEASKFIYDVCVYLQHNPSATNEEAVYAIAQSY